MGDDFPVRAYLEDLIRSRGPISFLEYMDAVLYHPEFGYYSRSRSPIGRSGDFYTSSNVDPAMGQLLGGLFLAMSKDIEGFTVLELGAGTGLMARHILEAGAVPYLIVERSAGMRRRQRDLLSGMGVEWVDEIPGGFHGCVFSNEFFDALPVRRFLRRDGRVREIFVGEGLVEVELEPEFPVDLPRLDEGAVADIAPDAPRWVRRIGERLTRGYHLAIDYGYLDTEFYSRPGGTLMCYRRHRVDEDPYSDPGEKDITAHVNFSELIEAGERAGLERIGYRTQKDFLVDLGLLEIMQPLARDPRPDSVRRLQALKTLILPGMMGERYRVLLQQKGVGSRWLPGFGDGESGLPTRAGTSE